MDINKRSELAKFLVGWRTMNNISARQLAEKIGAPASFVTNVENDKFEMPISLFKKLGPMLNESEKARVKALFIKLLEKELGF